MNNREIFIDKLRQLSKEEMLERYIKLLDDVDYVADLETKLAGSEKRLKDIDSWKENYGYSNYEDVYMLEDLQSRAFQSEDDTKVVDELLDYLNISDETEILPTLKQQFAEKEKGFNWIYSKWQKCVQNHDQDKIQFCIEQLEKLANNSVILEGMFLEGGHYLHQKRYNVVGKGDIENLIKQLKEGK